MFSGNRTMRNLGGTHRCVATLALLWLLLGVPTASGQDPPPLGDLILPVPEDPDVLEEPHQPGTIEGTGTEFAVTDSEYLNVTLQSTEPVELRLESVPEMIVIRIQAAEGAAATQITLDGLAPSTTYYMYQDDYHNLTTLLTDDSGVCTYAQDLAEPHIVFIQPRASTKFIPTDTTIGTWNPYDRVYTLNANVSETIQIDEGNLTFDGNGKTITGSGPYSGSGVYLNGKTGVTITNVTVANFTYGLALRNCSNNTLTANTASDNIFGIDIDFSQAITLTGNTVSDNSIGICLYASTGNTLTANTATNNSTTGILLSGSSNHVLTGNSMSGNGRYNFDFQGEADAHYAHDINTSNTVDGKPLYYVVGDVGGVYDASTYAGVFYAISCDGITIKDLTLTGNGAGVRLWNTHNSTIENVTASNNRSGIGLHKSDNNTLIANTVSNNEHGITLSLSDGNVLTGNIASDSTTAATNYGGIHLSNSHWNTLTGNTALDNPTGFCCRGANNSLIGNTASNNATGFYCVGTSNVLTGNTATNNSGAGIWLQSCSAYVLTGNSMSGNGRYNFYIQGEADAHYAHDIDTTNTVDGKPVYYLVNDVGGVYDSSTNAGVLYAISCDGITIKDLTLSGNRAGVRLWNTHNSTIENVTASNNTIGIWVSSSTGNVLTGNATSYNGIGIGLGASDANTLAGNSASNNSLAIMLYSSSSGNTLTGNTADSNEGVGLYLSEAAANTLNGNTSSNNELGMHMRLCSDNQTWNNNFINNATQALVTGGSGNVFNLPSPIGGNYWSDWTGPDSDGDGIVDVPYAFTGGQDNLPWVVQDGWMPQTMIEQIISDVLALNLQNGIENSLDSKLDAAQQALDDLNNSNNVAAINALGAFINAVQAQSGVHIPADDANALIAAAQQIIDLLSS
ncbi:MAG: right-handed parallel beta-helix repeat-containing protein [Phycisphaerales bacterium]|nr:MAG: right-handed parallel beta-helix repeat-containing protein [Phycisphaerales bacterium]